MIADDVWRYIILAFAAGTIAKLTNNSANLQDAYTLLNEALQRLNNRISSGHIQSDETLGAIACLANWSVGTLHRIFCHPRLTFFLY